MSSSHRREQVDGNTIASSIGGGDIDLEEVFLHQHKESLLQKNDTATAPLHLQ